MTGCFGTSAIDVLVFHPGLQQVVHDVMTSPDLEALQWCLGAGNTCVAHDGRGQCPSAYQVWQVNEDARRAQ